jgi:hypothetical protein
MHRLYSGIFVGFACDWIVDRQWRVLLGTASIPALILLFLVFLCPESPRFLLRKGDYKGAFASLRQLRGTDIQAARDLYYIHSQLQIETEVLQGKDPENWYKEQIYQEQVNKTKFLGRIRALCIHPRNRRACLAAFLVMASQQLCGVSHFLRHIAYEEARVSASDNRTRLTYSRFTPPDFSTVQLAKKVRTTRATLCRIRG